MKKFYGPKYGKRAYSNIKWEYNFNPLAKITIVVSILLFIGSMILLWQEMKDREQRKVVFSTQEKAKNNQENKKNNELKALEGILINIKEKHSQPSQKIHIWNEDGRVHASNTNYPTNKEAVRTIDEVTSPAIETKYIKQGSGILLPVVVSNNGKTIQVNMLLDTGCSITMLDAEISNVLNMQPSGIIQSAIADGSKIMGKTGRVDFFQVGPFRESGFLVNTMPIQGNGKTQYGLLGMNFLEKHPFTIDHRRQVIMWQ